MSSKLQPSIGRSENTNSSSRGSTFVTGSRLNLPVSYGGLGMIFFEQLSLESDKILQVDTIHNITENKGSVKARGIRLALEMRARGVGINDIILIASKTHAHQTIVLLATLFIGAIVCPINPEEPYKECLRLVKKLKPRMCFCDTRTVSQIDRILQTLNISSDIVNFGNELAGTIQFIKLFPFKEEPEFKPIFIESPHKEVAFILPTQGTCGESKLICLSHHNIYTQAINFMELFENPSKITSFFPLCWITQTILACTSLEYGVTRIMAPNCNERTACKIIHDFVVDVAILGTDLALRMTSNVAVKDFNLSCLKCILVGMINTTKEDLQQIRSALPNAKLVKVYAMTETGHIAAVSSSNFSASLEKPTAVGKLLKNCKIKILDIETKQQVGPEKFGELYFKGDGLMLGYFKDNTGTLDVLEKGYFRTGDLGQFDAEGWIYLQGRIDDMIYVNDSLVSPVHVENCLLLHPHIRDVAIIGNQNELIACIEKVIDSKLTTEHIMMFLHKRMPAYQKMFTKIVFFDELPRTDAGHIKKQQLREKLLQVRIEYTTSLASITTTNNSVTLYQSASQPASRSVSRTVSIDKDSIS